MVSWITAPRLKWGSLQAFPWIPWPTGFTYISLETSATRSEELGASARS